MHAYCLHCVLSSFARKTLTWKYKIIVHMRPSTMAGLPSTMFGAWIFTNLICKTEHETLLTHYKLNSVCLPEMGHSFDSLHTKDNRAIHKTMSCNHGIHSDTGSLGRDMQSPLRFNASHLWCTVILNTISSKHGILFYHAAVIQPWNHLFWNPSQ